MPAHKRTLLTRAAIALVDIYRNTLSHIMLHSCRFIPSCSEYGRISIERYGALRGMWYAGRRILRCHPLSRGGVDPVK